MAPMTEIRIDIKDKVYPSVGKAPAHTAIKDLHLALRSGEFTCMVGPSGCGKTTLLHILAGLDREFDGQITVESGTKNPTMGYVFQNPRLLPWRTVRQNIELVLPPGQSRDVVDPLLEAMELEHVQHVFPERLSLGMSRRVALIRAFSVEPDLLIMDEPFVSLDAPTARRVRNLLRKVWEKRPHTVLFVTHDLREAIALADRLIFLSPPPAGIVADINVDLTDEARHDETYIENFRGRLFREFGTIKNLI